MHRRLSSQHLSRSEIYVSVMLGRTVGMVSSVVLDFEVV